MSEEAEQIAPCLLAHSTSESVDLAEPDSTRALFGIDSAHQSGDQLAQIPIEHMISLVASSALS